MGYRSAKTHGNRQTILSPAAANAGDCLTISTDLIVRNAWVKPYDGGLSIQTDPSCAINTAAARLIRGSHEGGHETAPPSVTRAMLFRAWVNLEFNIFNLLQNGW